MSETCEWLHEVLAPLPVIEYPFDLKRLPRNGIYFFYEHGEACGHIGPGPRIVRVGTHKEGNFRSRIAQHFLHDERKMDFDLATPRPHDRSIFRKHIGRALLNRDRDPYLEIWDVDMTPSTNRATWRDRRDIDKEKQIEGEVTQILRERFSFRFVVLEGQEKRMGTEGIESRLIGTLAKCQICQPSPAWLGLHSPTPKMRQSGLWLVQHLDAPALDEVDRETLDRAIANTQRWAPDYV